LCMIKIEENGNIIFNLKIGGERYDSGGDVIQLDNNDYVITGSTSSYGSGGYDVWLLKFSEIGNNVPNKPSTPSGAPSGKIREPYTYTTMTTDPDNDHIYYLFDWGDESDNDWIGPYDSGDECSASHIWTEEGNYEIKVKAKDIHGAESDWSDPLSVSMPKNKVIHLGFFELIKNHPFLFPLLRLFLNLKGVI